MWDRARPRFFSLFLLFFFFSSFFLPLPRFLSLSLRIARMHHAHGSRGLLFLLPPPGPSSPRVYQTAGVLEMMATAAQKKSGSARRVLRRRDARITPFISTMPPSLSLFSLSTGMRTHPPTPQSFPRAPSSSPVEPPYADPHPHFPNHIYICARIFCGIYHGGLPC